ncbi:unnamed protein product, partial [Laminaria digitata]
GVDNVGILGGSVDSSGRHAEGCGGAEEAEADDERPRHALVVSCAPGQISKADITMATDVARAADEAACKIRTRRVRHYLMDRCAKNVETFCRER